jgi:hypothetical protein
MSNKWQEALQCAALFVLQGVGLQAPPLPQLTEKPRIIGVVKGIYIQVLGIVASICTGLLQRLNMATLIAGIFQSQRSSFPAPA